MANPVNPRFIQAQSFALSASGASAGSTSITLQSFLYSDGVTYIQTADLGDWCYMTLEPNNGTQEEAIQFTGVTQNANGTATLTGVSSVGFKYPYTVTSGLALSHAGGVTCIISNDAALYGNIINYINTTTASGIAPVASTSVKGLVQLATLAQINAGTPTGSTGASLVITPDQLILSNYNSVSVPSGALVATYGSAAPTGYLTANGQLVSRTTYANLYNAIGTTYATGNGSTTVGLPSMAAQYSPAILDTYASGSASSSSSFSYAHTVATGATILVASVESNSNVSFTATYASATMTAIDSSTTNFSIAMFYIINPSPGINNVNITPSGSCNMNGSSLSFFNVKSFDVESKGANSNAGFVADEVATKADGLNVVFTTLPGSYITYTPNYSIINQSSQIYMFYGIQPISKGSNGGFALTCSSGGYVYISSMFETLTPMSIKT